jgi:glycosyltransferase involved in cell wall biosynthesis
MKVGIISFFDPHTDKRAQSGILHKINQSIALAGFETLWIKVREPMLYKLLIVFGRIVHKLTSRTIYWDRTLIGTYVLAKTLNYKAIEECDVLVFVHNYWILHRIKTDKPIVYHSDCTFELADGYYLKKMFNWNVKQAEEIELESLKKVKFHISSSDWRQNSVINHYNISDHKCFVLEYGPCIEIETLSKDFYKEETLHLLFMAVEWNRKGGDIAVETCNILNSKGIKTILHIVGIKEVPDSCKNNPHIDFAGYLNKNNAEEYERLQTLLALTDVMILPTRAECSAIVYCENSAYGNPIVTYDTGGVGSYVINGLNGYRLPLTSDAMDFANKINTIIEDNELYDLSKGGKELYQRQLNWENWTKWFKEHIK